MIPIPWHIKPLHPSHPVDIDEKGNIYCHQCSSVFRVGGYWNKETKAIAKCVPTTKERTTKQ